MRRFRQAASKLEGLPGLVGTFRGVRRHRGRWTTEETLTCYVRRKLRRPELSRDELIHPQIDGVPTDVIAIGHPRLHADVDTSDRLAAIYDGGDRRSAVSALVVHDGEVLMLGSGHGLLPVRNGAYLAGSWSPGARKVRVFEQDGVPPGSLWFGDLGNDADYAVVRFPGLGAPPALPGHILAKAPIPIAPRRVRKHDVVQHVAAKRGYRICGRVVADAIPDQPIRLRSGDGIDVAYQDVIAVAGEDDVSFSVKTESGSLVFDQDRRALGFVVGGGADPENRKLDITFVLRDFATLKAGLGSLFSRFFTKGDS